MGIFLGLGGFKQGQSDDDKPKSQPYCICFRYCCFICCLILQLLPLFPLKKSTFCLNSCCMR